MVEDSKPHTAKDHTENQPKSNFELDLKKSAFLEPTVKEFQLPPRSKSCKRAIW